MQPKVFLAALIAMLTSPVFADNKPPVAPEEELRSMLQGYSAGTPQRCLVTSKIRKMKIIDQTALVVSSGGTLYVNRPVNPAALRRDLIPVFEPDNGRLCSSAQVSLRASSDFWNVGAVRLQDWVPYRRDKKD
jgi:hypothetical protein